MVTKEDRCGGRRTEGARMSAQEAAAKPEAGLDVRHDTFTISRRLDAAPAVVFSAFADSGVRRRWFRLPGSGSVHHHEFQVGGGETAHSTFSVLDSVPERLEYRSRYLDIVPDRRIVFVYESTVDGLLRWTSLVTVLLADDSGSTLLKWTEQVAFLTRTGDGSADLPHLRGATTLRLNGLAAALDPEHGARRHPLDAVPRRVGSPADSTAGKDRESPSS